MGRATAIRSFPDSAVGRFSPAAPFNTGVPSRAGSGRYHLYFANRGPRQGDPKRIFSENAFGESEAITRYFRTNSMLYGCSKMRYERSSVNPAAEMSTGMC